MKRKKRVFLSVDIDSSTVSSGRSSISSISLIKTKICISALGSPFSPPTRNDLFPFPVPIPLDGCGPIISSGTRLQKNKSVPIFGAINIPLQTNRHGMISLLPSLNCSIPAMATSKTVSVSMTIWHT